MPTAEVTQFILEMRWFDTSAERWTAWEIVSEAELRAKYGANPQEWKRSCEAWIGMGGKYEYRISKCTTVWELSYLDKPEDKT